MGGTDGDGKISPKVLALLFLQGPLGIGAPGGEGGGGGGGHRNGIRNSLLCPSLLGPKPWGRFPTTRVARIATNLEQVTFQMDVQVLCAGRASSWFAKATSTRCNRSGSAAT